MVEFDENDGDGSLRSGYMRKLNAPTGPAKALFLVRIGFVKDKERATLILLGIIILSSVTAFFMVAWSGKEETNVSTVNEEYRSN